MGKTVKDVMSKSKAAKEAHSGKDMGKKNGPHSGFKAVMKNAEKEGMSEKSAKKVAGSQFWKMHKGGKL